MTIQERIKEHEKAIKLLNSMLNVKDLFRGVDDNYVSQSMKEDEQKYDEVLNNLCEKVY